MCIISVLIMNDVAKINRYGMKQTCVIFVEKGGEYILEENMFVSFLEEFVLFKLCFP